MKKYFLNDGTAQQGPFDLDELKLKNLTAETPVWYEGLPEWTTAGKLDELKDLFIPAATAPAAEAVTVTTITTEPVVSANTASAPGMAKTNPAVVTGKKSTAWLSWVLSLLILGGVGYFVYDDMQKNKTVSEGMTGTEVTTDSTSASQTDVNESSEKDTATLPVTTTTTADTGTTVTMETQPVTTTTTTTAKPNPALQTAAQKEAAKKAEEQKKKQLATQAQKKAEEEKKRIQLAEAAAREMEMRNNWPRYITFGKLNYQTKGDGISAFDVPVYNGTNAVLDKVTVRIEYLKKEKKIFKTETIVIYNIPPKSVLNGVAPESKKGEKVNVYITGVNSRRLHLCFPQNNGNPADPYFCN